MESKKYYFFLHFYSACVLVKAQVGVNTIKTLYISNEGGANAYLTGIQKMMTKQDFGIRLRLDST